VCGDIRVVGGVVRTVAERIATYRIDIRERATRIVDDLQRQGQQAGGERGRERAILRVCEVLAQEER
jgi:hypothetical protein